MIIIRDEQKIARLKRLSKWLSTAGIVALVIGMILAFTSTTNALALQLVALGFGWIFSQVGMYLAHRYVRDPRPDEVVDKALGKVTRKGRLYHYLLPASHVLLMETGLIVIVAKYQGGKISVENDKWQQKGLGMRKFFGQENLGNPTREAEDSVKALAAYIHKHAPEIEEVPIGALIVFTAVEPKDLDLKGSQIPAMHHSKVKSYLRRKRRTQPLSDEYYNALRAAFDLRATHLLTQDVDQEVNDVKETES
ncbi:MAG: NERD domain-containing protein [Anaerolineales bacterium]|nr:NERD domain-containing protein [Anaerolineales bacterium]